MSIRVAVVEVRNDGFDFFGVVFVGVPDTSVRPECPVDGRRAVGPPKPRVDASRRERVERTEQFCDLERTVVIEQSRPRTEANRVGFIGEVAKQYLGGCSAILFPILWCYAIQN